MLRLLLLLLWLIWFRSDLGLFIWFLDSFEYFFWFRPLFHRMLWTYADNIPIHALSLLVHALLDGLSDNWWDRDHQLLLFLHRDGAGCKSAIRVARLNWNDFFDSLPRGWSSHSIWVGVWLIRSINRRLFLLHHHRHTIWRNVWLRLVKNLGWASTAVGQSRPIGSDGSAGDWSRLATGLHGFSLHLCVYILFFLSQFLLRLILRLYFKFYFNCGLDLPLVATLHMLTELREVMYLLYLNLPQVLQVFVVFLSVRNHYLDYASTQKC